jgi:mannose/fructose/N-acetylgalactosamine-specific phosphotransferase system component IID
VAASLEARAAAGEPASAARAAALKAVLGAALSGSADACFWGALRPAAGALAILVAASAWRLGRPHALAEGAVCGLLAFNVPALWARWSGLERGLSGDEAVAAVARLPVQGWIRGARRAAAALVLLAAWAALGLPQVPLRVLAAAAFAAGAGLSHAAGGPLRLTAAAFAAGALACAAGWAP